MKLSDGFSDGAALITYVCAGDPSIDETPNLVERMMGAGADIVELGLPFSDPVADGKVIQAASGRALANGIAPDIFFDMVGTISASSPLAVMTYYNLIFRRGINRFVEDCVRSDIKGIIVPDLPPEEAEPLKSACDDADVGYVGFVAPSSTDRRLVMAAEISSGFLYVVSKLGVTGGKAKLNHLERLLNRIDGFEVKKAVGFGIKEREQAKKTISIGADGVIVGSAIVEMAAMGRFNEVDELVKELKAGCIEGLRERRTRERGIIHSREELF
ncbi:MAG: tryptophan synthase subunit alpha [Methermicoccaceae archaeon]